MGAIFHSTHKLTCCVCCHERQLGNGSGLSLKAVCYRWLLRKERCIVLQELKTMNFRCLLSMVVQYRSYSCMELVGSSFATHHQYEMQGHDNTKPKANSRRPAD